MVILKDIPCKMSLLLIRSVLEPYWWVRGDTWDIKGWKAPEVFLLCVFSVRLCPVIHVQDVCSVSICNNYYAAAVHMIQWQNGFIWDPYPVSISLSFSQRFVTLSVCSSVCLFLPCSGSEPCGSCLGVGRVSRRPTQPCFFFLSRTLSLIAGILQWCWNVLSLCLTVVSSLWTF